MNTDEKRERAKLILGSYYGDHGPADHSMLTMQRVRAERAHQNAIDAERDRCERRTEALLAFLSSPEVR